MSGCAHANLGVLYYELGPANRITFGPINTYKALSIKFEWSDSEGSDWKPASYVVVAKVSRSLHSLCLAISYNNYNISGNFKGEVENVAQYFNVENSCCITSWNIVANLFF